MWYFYLKLRIILSWPVRPFWILYGVFGDSISLPSSIPTLPILHSRPTFSGCRVLKGTMSIRNQKKWRIPTPVSELLCVTPIGVRGVLSFRETTFIFTCNLGNVDPEYQESTKLSPFPISLTDYHPDPLTSVCPTIRRLSPHPYRL